MGNWIESPEEYQKRLMEENAARNKQRELDNIAEAGKRGEHYETGAEDIALRPKGYYVDKARKEAQIRGQLSAVRSMGGRK